MSILSELLRNITTAQEAWRHQADHTVVDLFTPEDPQSIVNEIIGTQPSEGQEWIPAKRVIDVILHEPAERGHAFIELLAGCTTEEQAEAVRNIWVHGWQDAGRREAISGIVNGLLEEFSGNLQKAIDFFDGCIDKLRLITDGEEQDLLQEFILQLEERRTIFLHGVDSEADLFG